MEIKLSAGDRINIPENCQARIEDDLIIIEEKQEEFKDGDILRSRTNDRIVIFSKYSVNDKELFDCYFSSTEDHTTGWFTDCFRHATEEEKQAFFNELYTKGLRWNAETKQMERIRWRVRAHTEYFYINDLGEVDTCEDWGEGSHDDEYYNLGNYYLTHERVQAEEDAKAIKAIYEKRVKAQQ